MSAKLLMALIVFMIFLASILSYISGCFAISWFLKLLVLNDSI